MPRAKQRTPELRARVLDAALRALADGGVAGLTARGVARAAGTSVPAVYELFGDKAGLVRALSFAGFLGLRRAFEPIRDSADPRADLLRVLAALRAYMRANPPLADVMFSRPFADFDPGPDDLRAGAAVREHIVGHVRRCVAAGALAGDATDIAHILVALVQGLWAQERAGWLGRSAGSRNRRWSLALRATLDGLR